jgi:hypothetical protein
MWFDAWRELVRVLLVGAVAYVFLVVLLRVSGKRTLAKLNAFDLVVTVALGSTLATILLSADVSWSEGVLALVLLVALQFVVAWTTSRWPAARSALTARERRHAERDHGLLAGERIGPPGCAGHAGLTRDQPACRPRLPTFSELLQW